MLAKLFADLYVRIAPSIGLTRKESPCPVCNGRGILIGAVDFNRSCEDSERRVFASSKAEVDYYLCERCGFTFAPEFLDWSKNEFLNEIYNDEYLLVDPELLEIRPRRMAHGLEAVFGNVKDNICHLDYGSGYGTLSTLLRANGWETKSYDPFFQENNAACVEKFDLVTAIEVFEHVPHPYQLMDDLVAKLRSDGVLYFTTLLSDGIQSGRDLLDWWYLAPRNGHVSLFSNKSLTFLLEQYDFKLASVNSNLHIAYRELPKWCESVEFLVMRSGK